MQYADRTKRIGQTQKPFHSSPFKTIHGHSFRYIQEQQHLTPTFNLFIIQSEAESYCLKPLNWCWVCWDIVKGLKVKQLAVRLFQLFIQVSPRVFPIKCLDLNEAKISRLQIFPPPKSVYDIISYQYSRLGSLRTS